MEEKYKNWIEKIKIKNKVLRGFCHSISQEMVAEFPELRLAKGYFEDDYGAKRSHWWCIAPDGTIVDPTIDQFESNFKITASRYEEYDELKHGPLPIGKCYNCGSYIYADEQDDNYSSISFCEQKCESDYLAYLESERVY